MVQLRIIGEPCRCRAKLRGRCTADSGIDSACIKCVGNSRVANRAVRIVHRTSQFIPLVSAQRTVRQNLLRINLHSGCFGVSVEGIAVHDKVYAVGVGVQILNGVAAEIILDIAAQRTEREAVRAEAGITNELCDRGQLVSAVFADAAPVIAAVGVLAQTGDIAVDGLRMQQLVMHGGGVIRCAEIDGGNSAARLGNTDRASGLDVDDR